MKQTLFLAVDGGGTKTVACLADMEGNILGVGRAAGSNALTVGQEQATASVMDAIGQATEGVDPGRIALCRLFIPGFFRAIPMLTVTGIRRLSSKFDSATRCRRRSAIFWPIAAVVPGRTTTNSSPP